MTDAKARNFELAFVDYPIKARSKKKTLLGSYVNYLVLRGAVISVGFGDEKADAKAKTNFQAMYRGRVVEMLALDSIYSDGGGIHCVTQQQPAL